jgi:glycosyltransferase involved in cell wall biosynthesis
MREKRAALQATPSGAVWYHALSARVGGGLTYQASVLPALARRLVARGSTITVLSAAPLPEAVLALLSAAVSPAAIAGSVGVRSYPSVDRSHVHRLFVDQVLVPWQAWRNEAAVLACMASHAPLFAATPRVVLLRNTIYFDRELHAQSTRVRRLRLRTERLLISAAAARAQVVLYPSESMRLLVESEVPKLFRRRIIERGLVNSYGVSDDFLNARARRIEPDPSSTPVFFVPSSATTQKNLGLVVEALVLAHSVGLRVIVELTCAQEELRDVLAARVRETGLVASGHLRLLGALERDAVLERLVVAHGCLLPSRTESFCHPAVEAMAVGCPLICADRPWARDICGGAAVFVAADDPAMLVEVWRSWGVGGVQVRPPESIDVAARFSWDRHVEVLDEALRKAVLPARATGRVVKVVS